MRFKFGFAAVMAAMLTVSTSFPVFAAGTSVAAELALDSGWEQTDSVQLLDSGKELPDNPLTFQTAMVEDGDSPGLYGTVSDLPWDTVYVTVQYSFNGTNFYNVAYDDDGWEMDREWDLTGLSEEDGTKPALTQLCIAATDHPLKAFQSKRVNSLYVRLEIYTQSGYDPILTETTQLHHEGTATIPDAAPKFTAKVAYVNSQYELQGTFTEFLPNTAAVQPLYSLDGATFLPISKDGDAVAWDLSRMGTEDPQQQAKLQTQTCALSSYEPLVSYVNQKLDRFFVKLQITTDSGIRYDSETAVIERGTQPIPEDTVIRVNYPASMFEIHKEPNLIYTYGSYQITVRENATPQEIRALLPNTLPVEVLFEKNGQTVTSGVVACGVDWKALPTRNLTAGEAFKISDAAGAIQVPMGSKVRTPLGDFELPESVAFDNRYARDEVLLTLNVIGETEKPDVVLRGSARSEEAAFFEPLSFAFWKKPSGATSIKAYSYIDGDSDWTEIGEMLSRRSVNANPKGQGYGYVDVLQPEDQPYADYLAETITGFSIGLLIEGGVFDGEQVVLAWPAEYQLPPNIPEIDGSGGNKGDVGSGDGGILGDGDTGNGGAGDGSIGDGSAGNGGQRPNLPSGNDGDSSAPESIGSVPRLAKKTVPQIASSAQAAITAPTEPATPSTLMEEPSSSDSAELAVKKTAKVQADVPEPEAEPAAVLPEPAPARESEQQPPVFPMTMAAAALMGGAAVAGISAAGGAGWLSGVKKAIHGLFQHKG